MRSATMVAVPLLVVAVLALLVARTAAGRSYWLEWGFASVAGGLLLIYVVAMTGTRARRRRVTKVFYDRQGRPLGQIQDDEPPRA